MKIDNVFRSLQDNELVQYGDIIKDVQSGSYYEVQPDTIEGFLEGLTAKQACESDHVNDVLRLK